MGKKFYIAASFSHISEVEEVAKELEALGFEWSHDWRKFPAARPFEKDPEYSRKRAIADAYGVLEADIFVLIQSHNPGHGGKHVEFGIALGNSIQVGKPHTFVLGARDIGSVFAYIPWVHYACDTKELLRIIQELEQNGNFCDVLA